MKTKSPNWKEQELILVLDLYLKHDLKWLNSASEKSLEIIEMSNLLRSLDLFDENIYRINNFRSPSSVHMKLMNFKALDPKYQKSGLVNVSVLDRKIWSDYYNNINSLTKEVDKILKNDLKCMKEMNVNKNNSVEQKLKECLNLMVHYNKACIAIGKDAIEISNIDVSQRILNYTFKGLTFSSENILEIEALLKELNINYNIEDYSESEKIGKYVQRTFSELIDLNILTNNDIKNLLLSDWSKKEFNINFPFLKAFDEMLPLSNQMKEGKYQRYWKKLYLINNKKYLVCKEWYESNRLYYNLWLKNIKNER
jgi:hypothetical protein